jgi:hypothetical protein
MNGQRYSTSSREKAYSAGRRSGQMTRGKGDMYKVSDLVFFFITRKLTKENE